MSLSKIKNSAAIYVPIRVQERSSPMRGPTAKIFMCGNRHQFCARLTFLHNYECHNDVRRTTATSRRRRRGGGEAHVAAAAFNIHFADLYLYLVMENKGVGQQTHSRTGAAIVRTIKISSHDIILSPFVNGLIFRCSWLWRSPSGVNRAVVSPNSARSVGRSGRDSGFLVSKVFSNF